VDKNRVDVLDYESIAEDIAKAYGNEHGFSKELRKELENKMVQNLNWITTGIFDFYPNDWMLDIHCIKISDYYHFESTDGGYLIELDDVLLHHNDNSVLESNWNAGKIPSYKYYIVDINKIMSNMINVAGNAYDISTDKVINSYWSGWFPITQIKLIKEIV
jgi:hypothetical protein